MQINIIGDTHSVEALESILAKYDRLYSLGDIAAVDHSKFIKRRTDYSEAWRFMSGKLEKVDQEKVEWFKKINIEGWNNQMKSIIKSGKNLKVCMGNSDYAMLKFFLEIRQSLQAAEENSNNKFKLVQEVSYENIDEVTIIFLPYTNDEFNLRGLKSSRLKQHIIILGHCPPYKEHTKQYYVNHYNTLKEIALSSQEASVTYFHGHIHADDTYHYRLQEISNLNIITPKAEDSEEGEGMNHHIVSINTVNGEISCIDSLTDTTAVIKKLPTHYRELPDHWNMFGIS